MKIEKMHMNTNARIVSKVLTRNKNTFYALKELINNSIQANATSIEINIIPSGKNDSDWQYNPVETIQIFDNGYGVPFSNFRKSILEIATDNKPEGFGVGRFSGLQIGRNMRISTIGFDQVLQKYTRTEVEFDVAQFEKDDITALDLNVKHEILPEQASCGYKIEIYNLYSNESNCAKKNKLGNEFQIDNFSLKLFEHYPLYVFKENIRFIVNGSTLKRSDFISESPHLQEVIFVDDFGVKHNVRLQYFSLKLKEPKVRLFIQCSSGGVQSTALELVYTSMWYAQSMGTQYILIDSDYLTQDFIDNCALGELNNEWQKFAKFLKSSIDDYYKKNNSKYTSFIKKLKTDKSYPYSAEELKSLSFSCHFFEQSAFVIEDDLKLLNNDDANRFLIYKLLRKVIDDGDISFIINHVMGLSKQSQTRLIDLLDKTNLEEVINFSTVIANRLHTLELIDKILLDELDKHVDLYYKISKMILKNAWMLGDEYANFIPVNPPQSIINILDNLFKEYIPKKASKNKNNNNLIAKCKPTIKRIETQIVYSARTLDYGKKEVSCVIIFAPAMLIGQKETSNIDSFLYALRTHNGYPKDKFSFKIYFLASQLNDFARMKINNSASQRFVYSNISSDVNDIRSYLMDWVSLLDYNREKLSCASETLKMNRIDVETAFLQEYPELFERKNTAQLRIVKR